MLTESSDAQRRPNSRLAYALRIEWLGQAAASVLWIVSVFTYGVTSPGDYLQLAAAACWFAANVATLVAYEG